MALVFDMFPFPCQTLHLPKFIGLAIRTIALGSGRGLNLLTLSGLSELNSVSRSNRNGASFPPQGKLVPWDSDLYVTRGDGIEMRKA
jgi:hypothetical protein